MKMNKFVLGTSAIVVSLSMTSMTIAAEKSAVVNLEVEIADTISMDCYESTAGTGNTTVSLSDATTGSGLVTAGVPSVGKSKCDVTTNAENGYYLTIEKSTEDVIWADNPTGVGTGTTTGTTVLTHEDPSIDGTWYNIPDLTAYDPASAGNAVAWTGTTKGLGFSVIGEPDATEANNTLGDNWDAGATPCQDGTSVAGGATDTAKYAGVPATPQAITAVPEYSETTTTTEVCYKVDVDPTQPSGQYAGQVTFTATTDASSYAQ